MNQKQVKFQKGYVLIVVLCMIVMLASILLVFNNNCRGQLAAFTESQKSEQALNSARTGLNIAIAAIRDNSNIYTDQKLLTFLSGREIILDDQNVCRIIVTQENSKLNINLLTDKSGKHDRNRIEQLLHLIDLLNQYNPEDTAISYGLAPAIIDWTDSDDNVTALPFIDHQNIGAEADYYSQTQTPYTCKNAPFDTLDELMLVKYITPDVFRRISEYLTVHGNGHININCASKFVIAGISGEIDNTLAQLIIDRRNTRPFESIAELRDIPGVTENIYTRLKLAAAVNPPDQYYSVSASGTAGSTQCKINVILRRNTDTKNIEIVSYKELYGFADNDLTERGSQNNG